MDKIMGFVPSEEDDRDFTTDNLIKFKATKQVELPNQYIFGLDSKWFPKYPTIRNQGNTPYCVLYSGSSAREIQELQAIKKDIEFIPEDKDIISFVEKRNGYPISQGTGIRNYLKSLQEIGCLSKSGKRYKISNYARLYTPQECMKAIFFYGCVQFGLMARDDLYKINKDNYRLMKWTGKNIGGHAQIAGGFNVKQNLLLVYNSWGRDHGNSGHYWMNADLLFNKELYSECWSMVDEKELA